MSRTGKAAKIKYWFVLSVSKSGANILTAAHTEKALVVQKLHFFVPGTVTRQHTDGQQRTDRLADRQTGRRTVQTDGQAGRQIHNKSHSSGDNTLDGKRMYKIIPPPALFFVYVACKTCMSTMQHNACLVPCLFTARITSQPCFSPTCSAQLP